MMKLRNAIVTSVLLSLSAVSVYANSAMSVWRGTDGYGVTVTDGECPLIVEHETLSFHIEDYPQMHYDNPQEFYDLKSSVTAEYTIHNPSDMEITAKLLFPFGTGPFYAPYDPETGREYYPDPKLYHVMTDGQDAGAVLRFSYAPAESFSLEDDLPEVQDAYCTDSFYRPDLPVHEFVYSVSGIDDAETAAAAKRRILYDPEKTRIFCTPFNGGTFEAGNARIQVWVENDAEIRLYYLGDLPEDDGGWEIVKSGTEETTVAGNIGLISEQEYTFEEFALRERPENSAVSETDWYNAYVSNLKWADREIGVIESETVGFTENSLMHWYEYEIHLDPGETIVNTVTVPMYPKIDTGWDEPVYTYTYLLSPAKTWKEFGSLEINIDAAYEMTDSSLGSFQKTEQGYHKELKGLPDKELEFSLCSISNPKRNTRYYGYLVLGFLGVSAVIFLLLVWLFIKILKAVFDRKK
ncbi:MAG: hypothetical protein IJ130_15040 [Solobacterium sp.]|nr:hypothetical protein [Solobacterium sp.]